MSSEQVTYRHTQYAAQLVWFVNILLASIFVTTVFFGGELFLLVLLSAICLLLYIFTRLTVEVSENRVSFWFGMYFNKTSVSTEDVISCQKEDIPASWGIGIRMSPNGSNWVYRIWGSRAYRYS